MRCHSGPPRPPMYEKRPRSVAALQRRKRHRQRPGNDKPNLASVHSFLLLHDSDDDYTAMSASCFPPYLTARDRRRNVRDRTRGPACDAGLQPSAKSVPRGSAGLLRWSSRPTCRARTCPAATPAGAQTPPSCRRSAPAPRGTCATQAAGKSPAGVLGRATASAAAGGLGAPPRLPRACMHTTTQYVGSSWRTAAGPGSS